MLDQAFTLRPANLEDRDTISALINRAYFVHRHLDWRPALDWVGRQPFWLLFQGRYLQAALACPEDPAGIAWVHLFAASSAVQPAHAWRLLFPKILEYYQPNPPRHLVAISLQRWFHDLLLENHFSHHQDIVVLNWDNQVPAPRPVPPGLSMRAMTEADLPAVAEIDHLAFEPIWQNSLESIGLAFRQSASATVAVLDGQIVGFQISTATPLTTHLARLAIHPRVQRQNVGYALVSNLFAFFQRQGSWQLTVNTQSDNHASLALYEKLGFERTGDQFPVMRYMG